MLYGSHYMEVVNGIKTGNGINGMKVGDGIYGADGINSNGVNGVSDGNGIKTVDGLNGVAHTDNQATDLAKALV
jgi:hypothetical protein